MKPSEPVEAKTYDVKLFGKTIRFEKSGMEQLYRSECGLFLEVRFDGVTEPFLFYANVGQLKGGWPFNENVRVGAQGCTLDVATAAFEKKLIEFRHLLPKVLWDIPGFYVTLFGENILLPLVERQGSGLQRFRNKFVSVITEPSSHQYGEKISIEVNDANGTVIASTCFHDFACDAVGAIEKELNKHLQRLPPFMRKHGSSS